MIKKCKLIQMSMWNGFKNFVWSLFHKNDLKMRHVYAMSDQSKKTERIIEIQERRKNKRKR